jgi:hypothetical protein
MSASDIKCHLKTCRTCKATYKWPTGGYSFSLPIKNSNDTNPSGVGQYPVSKKAKNKVFPNPPASPIPAPLASGTKTVFPTSGYSYNVPSTNKQNTNPNGVGKYPKPGGKKNQPKAFPEPPQKIKVPPSGKNNPANTTKRYPNA